MIYINENFDQKDRKENSFLLLTRKSVFDFATNQILFVSCYCVSKRVVLQTRRESRPQTNAATYINALSHRMTRAWHHNSAKHERGRDDNRDASEQITNDSGTHALALVRGLWFVRRRYVVGWMSRDREEHHWLRLCAVVNEMAAFVIFIECRRWCPTLLRS